MRKTCNADYWEGMQVLAPGPAPYHGCGREFDDAEQSTICPHVNLPTREEKEEQRVMLDALFERIKNKEQPSED